MPAYNTEKVLSVHHWNDNLFSLRTTRPPDLRFHSGHFLMLGMEVEGKPLLRAYSIASAHYDEHLEFLSIKVPQGPLTSRLQHLQPGDAVLLSRKPVGTLLVDDLLPGRHVYLLASGTGLAPFLSVIQNPLIYERFEKVVLVHSVRTVSELAYSQWIGHELRQHELVGEQVSRQLLYVPTVTRESFHTTGRITTLPPIAGTREALALSQAEFARLLGVSVRTLQEWEQGRRAPSGEARTLILIANRNPKALLDVA